MQSLTNIEINTASGGTESAASFFRDNIAQQIYEENHRPHINITTKTLGFIIYAGVHIATNIAYAAALIVFCTYLCIKDTYINNYHKKDHKPQ